MKKPFCDLCGEPAMDNAFDHLSFDRKSCVRTGSANGFSLTVEFGAASDSDPLKIIERADCCKDCMVLGLELLAKKIRDK